MSTAYLTIILDVLVLGFLGITIFYALKLSQSLNNFRAYRREFDGLMQDLNKHIEHAYEAVHTMKETSNRSAGGLEKLYRDAQRMSDELKIINETSNNLANRLESLSVGAGKQGAQGDVQSNIQGNNQSDVPTFLNTVEHIEKPAAQNASPVRKKKKGGRKRKQDGFAIQDREFEGGAASQDLDMQGFQSEAERELYEALKDNKAR